MSKKNGRFEKGNTIGFDTRFQPGNTLTRKYKDEYADSILNYFKTYNGYPCLEGWATENDVSVRTVRGWAANAEEYPRFADSVQQCRAIQKKRLMEMGLVGRYNAQMAKFLLSAIHGMSEKSTSDTTVTFNVAYGSPEIDEESY